MRKHIKGNYKCIKCNMGFKSNNKAEEHWMYDMEHKDEHTNESIFMRSKTSTKWKPYYSKNSGKVWR